MKYLVLLLLTVLCLQGSASAQSNGMDKKLKKVQELLNKEKFSEAGEELEKLLAENEDWGEGWDMLVKLRIYEYDQALESDKLFTDKKITITTKDKNGKEVKDDSLAQQFAKLFSEIRPSKEAYKKLMYAARKATLKSNETYYTSAWIRQQKIDREVDSNVNKKALRYYKQAEEKFEARDFGTAAKLYQHALDEQPDFYKAALYLGDSYYFMENYGDAITSFKAARDRFPDQLEPRKYLTDAYAKAKLWDKSADEAIACMCVYPDYSMNLKLEDALYMTDRKCKIKWMRRGVFPNVLRDSAALKEVTVTDKYAPVAKGPWQTYLAALGTARPFCTEQGILRPNELTRSRYLEVYSWEEMLRKHPDDPALAAAKTAQERGYLDCYVLVTLFHHDLYDQYHDFVAKNGEKVKKYYADFIR